MAQFMVGSENWVRCHLGPLSRPPPTTHTTTTTTTATTTSTNWHTDLAFMAAPCATSISIPGVRSNCLPMPLVKTLGVTGACRLGSQRLSWQSYYRSLRCQQKKSRPALPFVQLEQHSRRMSPCRMFRHRSAERGIAAGGKGRLLPDSTRGKRCTSEGWEGFGGSGAALPRGGRGANCAILEQPSI